MAQNVLNHFQDSESLLRGSTKQAVKECTHWCCHMRLLAEHDCTLCLHADVLHAAGIFSICHKPTLCHYGNAYAVLICYQYNILPAMEWLPSLALVFALLHLL